MAATLTEKTIPNLAPRDKPFEVRDKGGKLSVRGLLIRVQPSGRKTFYVEIGRGKRERLGDASQHTLTWARNQAREILGKAAAGHDFQAERQQRRKLKDSTLRAYLDDVFTAHAEANIASHREFLRSVRKGFAHVLDKPMAEITELDMAAWARARSEVSIETRRRELSNLKSVLNHAVSTGVIPGHQLGGYKARGTLADKPSETKVRFLSHAEERRLRAALDAREHAAREARERYREWQLARHQQPLPTIPPDEYADYLKPLTLVALNTGLRRGDLFDLQWQHVDLDKGQIRKIIGKSSHSRRKAGKRVDPAVLPLSAEACQILRQCQRQWGDHSHVFTSPKTGGPLTDVKKSFAGVLKDAGIEAFRFHDLRHSFASRLVAAGVDLNTVRTLMTHADIKMTLIYSHLSPDHMADAVARAFGGEE